MRQFPRGAIAMKRSQEAQIIFEYADGTRFHTPISGVNTDNVVGKLTEALKTALNGCATDCGVQITIDLSAAEIDEFANPER
jgi:hypothetical protein